MEFVHRCHFCGWQREAASATILEPRCEHCGCLLSSGRSHELDLDRPAVERSFVRALTVPPGVARPLRVGAFVAVMFTAAATGWDAGGAWIGLAAMGASGLAVTPALAR